MPWIAPRKGGYGARPASGPKPPPPKGRGAVASWIWSDHDPGGALQAEYPPMPDLVEEERVEEARIYGPRGEVLSIFYDRGFVPFGFTKDMDA